MLSFDFKKSSRKCYQSDREFQPGEDFFSALIECDDGSAERRDYSSEHWQGPPEETIGWWKCTVPELGKGRVYWAPKKVLLAYFEHVQQNSSLADIAFVTGLLLVQRKILILVDEDSDTQNMVLRNRSEKTTYEIPVVDISPSRLIQIQDELSEKLFMDQPDSDEFDDDSEEDADGAND